MNDLQIRVAYHRKRLRRHHADPSTLVLDELGLQHGKCRADIAVVNGHLIGHEIKSDVDSLGRLSSQIDGYNAVFDRVSVVVTERHLRDATCLVPEWWGVVSAIQGPRGGIHFKTIRPARRNYRVDDFSVAQLLWRDEAKDILVSLGVEERQLRGNRSILYGYLVNSLGSRDLRARVREKIRNRRNWPRPVLLFPDDDSLPPGAT